MIFKIYTKDENNNITLKDIFSDVDSALVIVAEEKDKSFTNFTDGDQLDMAIYNIQMFSEEEMIGVMNGKKENN